MTIIGQVGEIRKGEDLGYKGDVRCIWVVCPDCGKQRWVQFHKQNPNSVRCQYCSTQSLERSMKLSKANSGERSVLWKGGRVKTNGYIMVRVSPDNFFFPMATSGGYVFEHRLVVANHLNRCLLPWEVVHHINGTKNDNRPENLELISIQGRHNTVVNQQLRKQSKQLEELTKLVRLLIWQNGQLLQRLLMTEGGIDGCR